MTTKRTRKGVVYVESDGEIVSKCCTDCSELKPIETFPNDVKGFAEKGARCKQCLKAYRSRNATRIAEKRREDADYYRKYRQSNRKKINENNRNWAHANREYMRLRQQKRRALLRALPNDLTDEDVVAILESFDNRCALTGEQGELHIDHFIPLASGRGGTTLRNMIPLRADLNVSKNAQNPLKWFAENKERFELDENRFEKVLEYLADLNGMAVPEYMSYIDSCFSNDKLYINTNANMTQAS